MFSGILKHQVQFKDVPDQPETKKTDKKSEIIRNASKSSKAATQDQLNEGSVEGSFDTNKNYTKNLSKTMNGTKVNKKFNLNEQTMSTSSIKQQGKRAPRVRNGQVSSKHKPLLKQKVIEVVDIDDDDDDNHNDGNDDDDSTDEKEKVTSTRVPSPKAASITPKDQDRPISPFLEIVENIAERIKRRNTSRTISNPENIQSAINQVSY